MEAATAPEAPPEVPQAVAEAPEAVAGPPEGSQAPSPGSEGPAEGSEDDRERGEDGRLLSREAASYRRQLRDTQAERDSLSEQLQRVQRAEIERLAGAARLAQPSDLWTFGGDLSALCREDGLIDAEAVAGLVEGILKARPGLQAPVIGDLGLGRGGTAAGRRRYPQPGLSQLLKP